jgi:hypothetical protein
MSEIPITRAGTTETKKVLRVGPKSLLLTIHENENYIHFYIGGTELYCIHGYILQPTSVFAQYASAAYGSLPEVKWNALCSIEGGFVRGFDTRMIVRLLTAYIAKNYPWVTGLRFTDTSERDCRPGSPVSLANLSFLTTGKTWYEKTFGAYIDADSVSEKHAIEHFQQKKKTFPWQIMQDIMGIEDSTLLTLHDKMGIQTLYASASTWQEFFGPLQTRLGLAAFCEFAAPWLDMFIDKVARIRFSKPTYVMPIHQTPPVSYTVSDLTIGGRRHRKRQTRKDSYRAGSSAIVGCDDE